MGGPVGGQDRQGQPQAVLHPLERAANRLRFGSGQPQREAGAEHPGRHRARLGRRGGREGIPGACQCGGEVSVERDLLPVADEDQFDDLAGLERAGQRGEQPPGELHRVDPGHADRERPALRNKLDPRAARAQHAI